MFEAEVVGGLEGVCHGIERGLGLELGCFRLPVTAVRVSCGSVGISILLARGSLAVLRGIFAFEHGFCKTRLDGACFVGRLVDPAAVEDVVEQKVLVLLLLGLAVVGEN